jgi:4-amino-4-deoxy-L-arabinose transferase-like glycosyltransferase
VARSTLPGTDSSPLGWADLVVIPLIAVLSVPPLLWFGHHWTVNANDTARYLLAGSQLLTGGGAEDLNTISEYNGGHGPGVPALIAFFMLLFGRDTVALVWSLRLLALLNPLLAYLLVKRISSPVAGLVAAALVGLLAFNVKATVAINIDALQLVFYLLSLLALLAAVERGGTLLPLLSGALLGAAILTKETSIVDLPLALLAVLLLDWEARGAVWHYLGVALVCLPWWTWVYLVTGEVYLVGALPAGLRIPILMAAAIALILGAIAYTSGIVDRFLESERRRRWSGWLVVVAWTVALTVLLLSTASYAMGNLSFKDLGLFLDQELLAPIVVVVPTLFAVAGYLAWKASHRENRAWRLLALAMLFQVPVCVLLTVQRWALRQFLVPQTLVFCVLAALVVAAGTAAFKGRSGSHRIAGAVGAVLLTTVLLVSSVQTVQALLHEDIAGGLPTQQKVTQPANGMVDWMARNVPEGERILIVSEPAINVPQANYLMYLDGGRHEWTTLQLDQGICVPRPNVQMGCDTEQNAISKIPPDALWVQTIGGKCKVISLSASNLLEQSRQSDADYVAVAGNRTFPAILGLPQALRASKAFDLAHANLYVGKRRGARQGIVLLEDAGRAPGAVPAWMTATTAFGLKRCEQARGSGYEVLTNSTFPNGITGPRGPFEIFRGTSAAR